MCIYKISNLIKSYSSSNDISLKKENNVIRNISLEIKRGEILGVIGKSGSGKTTLLKILGGILMPTSGKVCYQGEDIYQFTNKKLEDYRRLSVGTIFQDYKLLDNISVRENIMLPALLNHDDIDSAIDRAEKTAKTLGIESKLDSYPYELSGGEKQRAAISRALINNPNVILADEPTGNLDPKTTMEVAELLMEIRNTLQKTIIIVTHDMEIGNYCDNIVKMAQGEIITDRSELKKTGCEW